ncbi:class I SAM-dependent RNA methyltransferase [Luminiphilus sp. nBUS_16]|uniref:class I SAM-dependent RNA methyltransferase n=1 Tax=Luminiphilus sp. nBUS_16 TaxID=3395315 RepID=UPI003EB9E663
MPRHRRAAKKSHASFKHEGAFEGRVRDLTSDGRGVVSHPDGRTFFVPGVWLDEVAEIRVVGRHGKVGLGQVITLKKADPQRREAPCRHHGDSSDHCGGCPWMFMPYEAQSAAKVRRLKSTIQGLGDSTTQLDALLVAPDELGYRNRAQLKTDGSKLGYVAAGTRTLIDVTACPILSASNREVLAHLRKALPNPTWRARKQDWQTIDLDDNLEEPSLNKRLPFRQGNTQQNAVMREWLAQTIASISPDAPVLELFAGSGNFTEVLATHFKTVVAVEGDQQALQQLSHVAPDRIQAHALNLFSLPAVEAWISEQEGIRALVLDPPREGLKVRAPFLGALKELETVIYVACDIATWARDCKDFLAKGFRLARVTPLDLFPQTPHLEVLSVLTRA